MNKESERPTGPSQEPRRANWTPPRLKVISTADTEGGANPGGDVPSKS
jgi:hypothetical protein